jgi:hypothetical protein
MDMGKIKISKIEGSNPDDIGRVYVELKGQKVEISDSDLFFVFSFNEDNKDKLLMLSNADSQEEYYKLKAMILFMLDKWEQKFGEYEIISSDVGSCWNIIRDHKNKN